MNHRVAHLSVETPSMNVEQVEKPVVVVTGGSRGIGAAIVHDLDACGWRVFNLDREDPVPDSPGRHISVDLRDLTQLRPVLDRLVKEVPVQGLVNNAGVGGPLRLEDVNMEAFDRLIQVNLRSAILCAQAFVPVMKSMGKGRIVNITSRGALGKEGRTIYSATKAALIGVTRTWALELGPAGITVNAVGPGPIATDLFHASNPPESPKTQAIINGIPMRRIGTPSDVAHAVRFFLSPEASFITGQTLFVCGGLTAGLSGA